MRPKISEFQCPEGFEEEYLLFQDAYEERHYANATIISNNQILHKFLDFLDGENITESSGITLSHVTKFLGYYSTAKPKYVATILYVMRNYLSFLYQQLYERRPVKITS
ncbi:hypothetical protein [Sporomusa acidovorans]|uniref:hypothetical protein n=1 Tax=Sporomusa acidovorans TaxID=112900 RepID=UPI0035A13B3D